MRAQLRAFLWPLLAKQSGKQANQSRSRLRRTWLNRRNSRYLISWQESARRPPGPDRLKRPPRTLLPGETDMQIYGPSQLHGAQPLSGPHASRAQGASRRTARAPPARIARTRSSAETAMADALANAWLAIASS